jgi:hypothetical protein
VATWAIDGTDGGYLARGLAHAAVVVVLAGGATAVVRSRGLRLRRHLLLHADGGPGRRV